MYIRRLDDLVFKKGDVVWLDTDEDFAADFQAQGYMVIAKPILNSGNLTVLDYLKKVTNYEHLYQKVITNDLTSLDEKKFVSLGGFNFYQEILNAMDKMKIRINLKDYVCDLNNLTKTALLFLGARLVNQDKFYLDNIDLNLNEQAKKWLLDYMMDSSEVYVIKSEDADFIRKATNKIVDSNLDVFDFGYDVYNGYIKEQQNARLKENKNVKRKREKIALQLDMLLRWKAKGEQYCPKDNNKSQTFRASEGLVKTTKRIAELNGLYESLEYKPEIGYDFLNENGLPIILEDLMVNQEKINGQINYGEVLSLDGKEHDLRMFLDVLKGKVRPLSGDVYNFTGRDFITDDLQSNSDLEKTVFERLNLKNKSFDDVTRLFAKYDIPINFVYEIYGDLDVRRRVLANILKLGFMDEDNLIIENVKGLSVNEALLLKEMISFCTGTVVLDSKVTSSDKILDLSSGLFSRGNKVKRLTK